MKIAHVSDLHFGAHHALLAKSLAARLAQLGPDLVVCSGDMADEPKEEPLKEALAYLEAIADGCTASGGPRLIVVPGNHDYRGMGFLWKARKNPYAKVFGVDETHHYYEKDNVWVFGFDSAQEGTLGGSGRIEDSDLDRFHQACESLASQPAFDRAFKIVVVHHHPLPVNWDQSRKDRWLTMTNAGRFLSAILFRKIDLVIHGHEHMQARARVWSTLGANDHEVTIVSLGSSLRRVQAPDRNWFSLITAEGHGVHIKFYGSVGDAFSLEPEKETFWVRTARKTEDEAFAQWSEQCGFFYRAVASVSILDRDGDSRRSIECEDLTITREGVSRASEHQLSLPHTSGYLDKLRANGDLGIRVSPAIPAGSRRHDFPTTIKFERQLLRGESLDYAYHWHAVNAFAMDRRQFDYMYSRDADQLDNVEFTHCVISDPIEQLTVVVKFPEDFALPGAPRLRVTRVGAGEDSRKWDPDPDAVFALTEEHALRYYESLHIAALRVRKPRRGLSYGIQWELPTPPRRPDDDRTIAVDELRSIWKSRRPTEIEQPRLAHVLVRVIMASRELLMPGQRKPWAGRMDASLMVFDGDHTLRVLSAAVDEGRRASLLDYEGFTLSYGDGVAGRSFKTNQIRVFVQDDGESDEPSYYTAVPGVEPHRVLISFPVQAPDGANLWAPYGVVSIGSARADCPLRLVQPGSSEWRSRLSAFKIQLDLDIYQTLTEIFLDGDTAAPLTGPSEGG